MDILLRALFSTCSAESVFSAISKTIQVPFGALDLFQPASQQAQAQRSGLLILKCFTSVDTLICLLICRNGQEWKTKKVINYEKISIRVCGADRFKPTVFGAALTLAELLLDQPDPR